MYLTKYCKSFECQQYRCTYLVFQVLLLVLFVQLGQPIQVHLSVHLFLEVRFLLWGLADQVHLSVPGDHPRLSVRVLRLSLARRAVQGFLPLLVDQQVLPVQQFLEDQPRRVVLVSRVVQAHLRLRSHHVVQPHHAVLEGLGIQVVQMDPVGHLLRVLLFGLEFQAVQLHHAVQVLHAVQLDRQYQPHHVVPVVQGDQGLPESQADQPLLVDQQVQQLLVALRKKSDLI